ncbi:MAG: hypothetical protein IMZ61_10780 [Planctomycetes bacterium]|nr:hypothetical protein [Planctomycetota bacterium]
MATAKFRSGRWPTSPECGCKTFARLMDWAALTRPWRRSSQKHAMRLTRSKRKGATYYAIRAGLLRIVEDILRGQNTALSISSFLTDYYGISDVCLSLPRVVDRDGVERVLKLKLNEIEMKGLLDSARVLKGIIPELGL